MSKFYLVNQYILCGLGELDQLSDHYWLFIMKIPLIRPIKWQIIQQKQEQRDHLGNGNIRVVYFMYINLPGVVKNYTWYTYAEKKAGAPIMTPA